MSSALNYCTSRETDTTTLKGHLGDIVTFLPFRWGLGSGVLVNQRSGGEKKKALIVSLCQFPWCSYSHHG